MRRKLSESVVVITGASSGIGRAAAHRFAAKGAAVVLAARDEAALGEAAAECERLGGRALVVPTDVTGEDAVQALARQAVETFGRIDVWVNNAGVSLLGRIEEVPIEAFRRVMETNFFGCVHGARAALPYMREQGGGVLINVASVAAVVGGPFTSAYSTSKFAVRGLSECLRMELRQTGADVDVVTLLPAFIDTPLFQHAANFTGRAVQPMDPVNRVEVAARAIVRAALHPRREIFVGRPARREMIAHALVPRLLERVGARKIAREHFADRPADVTLGNLFAPRAPQAPTGGWKSERSAWGRLAVAGLLAVPALLAWRWRAPRTRGLLAAGAR